MPAFCSSLSNLVLTIGVVLVGIFIVQHTSDFEAEEYSLPKPPKLEGPLAPNNHLRNAKLLLHGQISGPESILAEGETLYTGTWDAKLVKIVNGVVEKTMSLTKRTDCDGSFESEPLCGRPLGIRRLNSQELIVIDAYLGIFVVDFDKGISRQVFSNETEIGGKRSTFFNDVDILDEDMDEIFFTVTSTKWDRRRFAYD
uniref:Adipocyte plasma membrane-associated protein n=1 Tax=Acrobeloides nanus TaxID=290746 RepID=A0A914D6T2_9BILA